MQRNLKHPDVQSTSQTYPYAQLYKNLLKEINPWERIIIPERDKIEL